MRRGFTLIELMVVAAIATILVLLVAPSFREFIEMQRLRSVAAQFATDVQFARSEAPARQRKVYLAVREATVDQPSSCYIAYTCPGPVPCTPCDCRLAEGSRCTNGAQELRTQQLPASQGVKIAFVPVALGDPPVLHLAFDPISGGMEVTYDVFLMGGGSPGSPALADISLTTRPDAPAVRTEIAVSGRPSQCSPGTRVPSMTACVTPP